MDLEYYHSGVLGLRVRRGMMNEWDKIITREVQHHYRFEGLDYSQAHTILDVGCNIGAFSLYMLSYNPGVDIVGVEVDNENAEIAALNLARLAILYHYQMGYSQGDYVLETLDYVSGSHRVVQRGEHKVIPPKGKVSSYHEITVPMITIEQIMKERNWNRINILKLDCEGAEYDILPHTLSLSKIDHIVGEYHDGIERFEAECLPFLAPYFEMKVLQRAPDWGRFWFKSL